MQLLARSLAFSFRHGLTYQWPSIPSVIGILLSRAPCVKGHDMVEATREQIAADLEKIFRDTMGDWEYSGEITAETRLFADLGLESIDMVALGAAIEEHYGRTFPFAQWLSQLREQQVDDIRVNEVIQFLHDYMNSSLAGDRQ